MEKALEKVKEMLDFCNAVGCHRAIYESLEYIQKELEDEQETIKNLKHNYDVQVEYNNTAYKNYTNMVNSLEKRIAELEEAHTYIRIGGRAHFHIFDVDKIVDQIYDDYEAQLKDKDEEIRRLKEAMQEFVNRCEKGEVRSKYTYTKFKELLKDNA